MYIAAFVSVRNFRHAVRASERVLYSYTAIQWELEKDALRSGENKGS